MTTKKFYEPSEIAVPDFKKRLKILEEKLKKCDVVAESRKGVKPFLLIMQQEMEKKKKIEDKQNEREN